MDRLLRVIHRSGMVDVWVIAVGTIVWGLLFFVIDRERSIHYYLFVLVPHQSTKAQSLRDMCEFCSFGPNSSRQNHGEDAFSMGLFSAEAIDQAVRQANEAKQQRKAAAAAESTADDGDGEDDDGT